MMLCCCFIDVLRQLRFILENFVINNACPGAVVAYLSAAKQG